MTSISNYRAGNLIFRSGLRPELIVVPSGSYLSNYSFGPGVTGLMSYNNVTLQHGTNLNVLGFPFQATTYCEYRRQDDFVVFSINMTFNAHNNAPTSLLVSTGDELRVRVLNPITNTIGGLSTFNTPISAYSRGLPIPGNNYLSPVLEYVRIYGTGLDPHAWFPISYPIFSQFGLSTGTSVQMRGGLLNDSSIALFYEILEGVNEDGTIFQNTREVPLLAYAFSNAFNLQAPTGTSITLVIQGQYICS